MDGRGHQRGGGHGGKGGRGRGRGNGHGKGRGKGHGKGGRGGGRGRGWANVEWESWQRELHLPDLNPGSPGLGSLKFACFRCGTTIVTGDQIYRVG
eukprot:SAG22_NODE_12883_length_426_cov_0.785933_2_plen_95_part_01